MAVVSIFAAQTGIIVVVLIVLVSTISAMIRGIDVDNPPYKVYPDKQAGYNRCGNVASPDSQCQNVWIKSATDFCLFGPATYGGVSENEREAVSYCTQAYHGARLIPPQTFTSIHYLETPSYIQITGRGNFSKLNVDPDSDGGEMDPHSFDTLGNPIGGLVFGAREQFEQWTEFLLPDEFCIRACHNGPDGWRKCNHIYDLMACRWNIPGDYSPGFDSCVGEEVRLPMGEYRLKNGSIYNYRQEDVPVPPPALPGDVRDCRNFTFPYVGYPART